MLDKINRVLKLGKIKGAKVLLKEYFEAQDKASWLQGIHNEYDILYPATRQMTDDEINEFNTDENGEPIEREDDFVYPEVTIDYSDDEDFITFEEYLNETKLITEAIYDEDGTLIEPEVTEPVRVFEQPDTTERIEEYIEPYLYELAKADAKEAITRITVTTESGNVFYADPESRADLSDAIAIMTDQGLDKYLWKTANGVLEVSIDDMIEARAKGLLEKGRIIGVN